MKTELELNGVRSGLKDATATDTGDPAARRAVYLTRADDIVPMIKVLRDHAAGLELRIPGIETRYTGRILDLSSDHFLLEDIRPRDGLQQLRRDTRFSFSARVDDLYICGEECRITKIEAECGLPYFRADLPLRMLRHRRRKHTRITLPPRVSPNDGTVSIHRAAQGAAPLSGQIIDVSVGGCRVAFQGAVLPALKVEERLSSCTVRVTASLELSARGTIRHSSWDAGQRITTCGIEFSEMAIPDRRRLEHYVSQLAGRPGKS